MKAMIFAAGLGTRLRPLTDTMPKALVPVNGHPLLEIQIRRLIAAGATDIVINVHHFADQIRDYVERNGSFGTNIKFSDETERLLETGGGIKKAVPFLSDDSGVAAPFLVHNVDILSNINLRDFYESGRGHFATLLVSPRATQRYLLFKDDNRLVGWTNVKTGEVRSPYPELDVEACRKYAFAGIHLFSPLLFPEFDAWGDVFSIIDFYLSICHRIPVYGHCEEQLRLMDVGKLDTLSQADAFYCKEYKDL
ncbi:MAG: nucleotidyltransferase family protein [Clostridium sp.]|nr:nucleotidyltransferase family protein [Clostridium sp.]